MTLGLLIAVMALFAAPDCDLLLTGGRVVDGTGAPWFRADVCVAQDRNAAVGCLEGMKARRRIDATDLVVAPGFIDMMGQSEYNVLVDGRAASKITQGITTEVTGEGSSIAPLNARMVADNQASYDHYGLTPGFTTLAGYFAELEKRGVAINLATFVGAGGVRNFVLGQDDRPPTKAELAAMEARVAARFGGSYVTHQRDEEDGIDASLDEVFRIAREAKILTEIYHLKTAGRQSE